MMAGAGDFHVVLLKNVDDVVTFGAQEADKCAVPALADREHDVSCAADGEHTVLLKNTGEDVTFGGQFYGQFVMPALAAG